MLCQFQVYSKVIQLYIYICSFFFRFFTHIGYYRVLSRVPCAVQQVLAGYLFYIWQCVWVNPKLLIYPPAPCNVSPLLLQFFILHLFLAALGLRCCVRASSSCSERELLFVVVRGLLIEVASLVAEHRLTGFSSCGLQAQLLCSMWELPGPGSKPESPALAGGFLTTVPQGKSLQFLKYLIR